MSETIAAISTAPGKGGISIIRISGDNAILTADKVFCGKKRLADAKTHTIHYGKIVSGGKVIDECLCSVMRAPLSYTTEDVVEINVHGGVYSAEMTLKAVLGAGARPAKPGEFTLRAFMNGRIDLSEAEAVGDIIDSKTALAQSTAVNQLEGKLKEPVNNLRKRLVEILGYITVSSDFPDEDPDSLSGIDIKKEIENIKKDTEIILNNADRGIIIREGALCAICGKPNVGKSSLLNALTGTDRAIVTEIEGTTRDVIEEYINIKGVPVKLADTAGIRENADEVEKIGVKKAKEYIDKADLCIFVADNSRKFEKEDAEIFSLLKNKKVITVLNKSELENDCTLPPYILNPVKISVRTGEGIAELADRIYDELMGEEFSSDSVLITNGRHKEALAFADSEIGKALTELESGAPVDLCSIYLESAVSHLGEITGMTVSDEVIGEVFSKFCIGK